MNDLGRRAAAEATGTAMLTMAVIGSGIAATRLSPGQPGMQLLVNSLVTGAALVALILAFAPVSAAFNPLVTLAQATGHDLPWTDAATVIGAQIAGAATGAVLANLMFDLDAVTISTHERSGSGVLLAEVVASAGLLLVIFGTLRARHGTETVAVAVGAYITAAYWFTSSTSFANPALTIARTLSDTFAGIAPASVPAFLLMELVGATAAIALLRLLHPKPVASIPEVQR